MNDAKALKKSLRREIAQVMACHDHLELRHEGEMAAQLFANWLKNQKAIKKVALFHSMKDEIDLSPIDELFEQRGIERFYAENSSKKAQAEKVLSLLNAALVSEMDLVLVPGRAFDRAGRRLGRGGGYYDRLLSPLFLQKRRPILMGIALPEQVVALVPCEEHDVTVDLILTPDEIITANASK